MHREVLAAARMRGGEDIEPMSGWGPDAFCTIFRDGTKFVCSVRKCAPLVFHTAHEEAYIECHAKGFSNKGLSAQLHALWRHNA